jgi:tetratricopeptide (TPR) repeat protein
MALYGLGKLHKSLADVSNCPVPAAKAKAMAFYQAALLAAPGNHLASNDLGVLLAQEGRYDEARLALEHSAALSHASRSGWQNLAVVYEHLGRKDSARWAHLMAARTGQREAARRAQENWTPHGRVYRVDPTTFAQTSQPGPVSPSETSAPSTAAKAAAAPARPHVASWPRIILNGRK